MAETIERRVEPQAPTARPGPRIGVVLAAGRSRRLARVTGGASKALVMVGGVPLVERAVRTLLAYGLDEVVVVVGYQAARVGAAAEAAAPGRVRTVRARGWRRGNGASLAAVEPLVAAESAFLLVTADHVFGDGALAPLLSARAPAALVDHAPDPATWAEGTRVALHEERAIGFSKELEAPAVDCGAFLLTPEIFAAYHEAARAGDHSLSGAVSALARRRAVAAVALPSGAWWHDVDTPADLRTARRKLRRALTKPTDGPVSRLLNRPVSTRISMALAPLRIHPDVVSWAALGLGVVAAWLLAHGHPLAGALAVHLTSVLDGVDGELDRVTDVAIAAGLGVWAVERGGLDPGVGVVLTAGATAASLLSMATKDRIAALGLRRGSERGPWYLLAGRDGRLLLVALAALVGRPAWALAALSVLGAAALVARLIAAGRSPAHGGSPA
jgi:CDP-L-myo-inositol myo-inositolphosphotransferase